MNIHLHSHFLKWAFLIIIFVNISALGAEWVDTHNEPDNNLYSLHFIDDSIGWAIGEVGTILKSIDGGESWLSQSSGTEENLFSVCFADSNIGVAVGNNGTLVNTLDGGLNWNLHDQLGQELTFIEDVHFINSNVGWSVGNSIYDDDGEILQPLLWKTENSGVDWQEVYVSNEDIFLRNCHFVDENIGWLAGSRLTEPNTENYSGIILKTENGGDTWSNVECDSTISDFSELHFIDENMGWMIGNRYNGYSYEQFIYKTVNGGENWTQLSLPESSTILTFHFVDQSRGIFTGSGSIWYTSDGGVTWSEEFYGSSYGLWSVQLSQSGSAWVVGWYTASMNERNGAVLVRYENTSTEDSRLTYIPANSELVQNFPNPFNPSTHIKFVVAEASHVSLEIFDLLGRPISRLIDEKMSTGSYEAQFESGDLSSGIYFYRIQMGDYISTRKMVISK